jgi:hypothetical protein
MSESVFASIRELPRQHLEDLAIRAIVESRLSQQQTAPNAYFLAVLSGFFIGTIVTVAGFMIGTALN